MTVSGASKYYSNILNQYKGRGLSVGSFLAGYDEFVYSFCYLLNKIHFLRAHIYIMLTVMANEFQQKFILVEAALLML
jgi:hypothetical protein